MIKIRILKNVYIELNSPEVTFTLGFHSEVIRLVYAKSDELDKPAEYFEPDRVQNANKLTIGFLLFNITVIY